MEVLDISLWAAGMVEGLGMLGLEGGDGAVRMMDNQGKRYPLYNNGWLSLITHTQELVVRNTGA